MTTTATPQAERSRSRSRSAGLWVRRVVLVLLGLLVLAVATLFGVRTARAGALPGVVVDGRQLGGLSAEALFGQLATLAAERGEATIRAVRGRDSVSGSAADLGYRLDVEATVDRVMVRGRQSNPVAAFTDHLRAFSGATVIEPVQTVDDEAVAAWADRAARRLERQPREGRLRFGDESAIRRVDPRAGVIVDPEPLASDARDLLLSGRGGSVVVASTAVAPVTTDEDVDDVLAMARQALSGPITLRRSGASTTVQPAEIAAILRTKLVGKGGDATLELRMPASTVTEAIGGDALAAFEQEPTDADIDWDGSSVDITPSQTGFSYDQPAAAEQLFEVATGDGPRDVELAGTVTEPAFTTADARALQLVEPVASFTTEHACCEPRVSNIHRIADIVDGALVLPGETFSVNDYVGPRTAEQGFVAAPAISDGEFVDEIGGGVSQFATTLYNAAFFGGYEIPVHKAHSYYISRYPEGREATLYYPSVDLQVTNNSPYGFIIDTSYSDTAVTATLFGKEWASVETTKGARTNVTEPEVEYEENDDLRPGEEQVIQSPSEGWDVTVTRTISYLESGTSETEQIFTTYEPQPGIIERNQRGVSADDG